MARTGSGHTSGRQVRRQPLCGTDSGGEGAQSAPQRDSCVASDLPLLAVLVIGLQELRILLLNLLRGLARRAEQQLLEVVVQVLASLRGYLAISDPLRQVPHKRGSRRSERRQGIGLARCVPLWRGAR
jgi:hypothetical protein